jgi:uncharacterized integral membrane protein
MNNDSQLDFLLKQTAEDHRPQLPSPGLIWWRAQILRKQQEQARIERPVKIMRMVAVVACLVVLAVLVTANREQLQMLLARETWLFLPLGVVLLTASLVSASLLWSAAKGR